MYKVRYLQIALRKIFPVSLSVNMPITSKRLEIDPTYGVSLDHKFHEECPWNNFLSGWLAGCLQIFTFIKIFAFSG